MRHQLGQDYKPVYNLIISVTYDLITSGVDTGVGFLLTLIGAMVWELLETTDYLINLFRENSGPSEMYNGDSKINSFGDVISCSLGFSISYILSRSMGGSLIPALAYILVAETWMALRYRDNTLLIAVQVLTDNPVINAWQSEIIPTRTNRRRWKPSEDKTAYWDHKITSSKQSRLYYSASSSPESEQYSQVFSPNK